MADFGNDAHNAGYFNIPEYDINNTDFNILLNADLDVGTSADHGATEQLNFLDDFGHAQDITNMANFNNSPLDSFSAPSAPYPPSLQQSQGFAASPTMSNTSPTSPSRNTHVTSPTIGGKRSSIGEDKRATSNLSDNQKDDLNVSAEEDKRRRNTAASARFRVKKKQREQAMEKMAKEMSEKVGTLESRIKELEKENRLLKGLLTEKAGKGDPSGDEDSGASTRSKRVKGEDER